MAHVIMIVDDAASVRELIGFTLENAGYKVIKAKDGQDALSKMDTHRPDLLLTDLHMSKMDGFELIRNVRSNSRFKFMPIVVITTEFDASKKKEAKAAGATAWIAKPFKADMILSVLRKLLA